MNRRNLIVAAPTNSGKSLVALLVLLDAIRRERRALLLVPLRALAREKGDELVALAPALGRALGTPFTVHVTTGDYRMEEEALGDPPPNTGELVIATPERIEVMLRNPEYDAWFDTIDAICLDEAHLISDSKRGPTFEYLITFALSRPTPPRIVLLSATIGGVDQACRWLKPCDVVRDKHRHPPLTLEVGALNSTESVDEVLVKLVRECDRQPDASVLVFVYQTRMAERIAKMLDEGRGRCTAAVSAMPYHSRMAASDRRRVRDALLGGQIRCVVTTTALGHGVNLPATHVIVRDTTFFGNGRLSSADVLQMVGRAGRGDRAGHAIVLVRPTDDWGPEELATALRSGELPELASALGSPRARNESDQRFVWTIASSVASLLARRVDDGVEATELRTFFEKSLGGTHLAECVETGLRCLSDPYAALAFDDGQGRFRLTTLGLRAVRSAFPLLAGAGVAQLIRDLLTSDVKDEVLARWTVVDHLLVLELARAELMHSTAGPRISSAEAVADSVDGWVEQHSAVAPILYRRWLRGAEGASKADQVMGSLGIPLTTSERPADAARRIGIRAMARAAILYERSLGTGIEDLERRWHTEIEGVEEGWRDELLWLLGGLGELMDLKCFYHHLREECRADHDRVGRVKAHLRGLRQQTFELRTHLRYASPLGPILRALRHSQVDTGKARVGPGTIKRLEEAGVTTFAQLAQMTVEDYLALGIRRDYGRQLRAYVRRRLR